MGQHLTVLQSLPKFAILVITCGLSTLMTEVVSNTATANIVLPILSHMVSSRFLFGHRRAVAEAKRSSQRLDLGYFMAARLMWTPRGISSLHNRQSSLQQRGKTSIGVSFSHEKLTVRTKNTQFNAVVLSSIRA